ncbi:cell division protein FtsL [Vibrio rumoiensis]|uniref:Cell division protein FtsL n=1 Tax=Vibrio rumoiensis 1S-45 TaxID=1188252 RepID=A0A1E5E245_9VIBR|nr:cell division protein FtsL [Vibrio rumoiensis]OEF24985.1 cell division protein FtsL [Vibrio rumoiensis 1S-45]
MTETNPPSLIRSIWNDLTSVGRLPLFLLVLIFSSSIAVVLTTYNTRNQITLRDELLENREKLDSEWRNLILEENSLAEHTRVQKIAIKDLDMKRPDSDKEVVVNFK